MKRATAIICLSLFCGLNASPAPVGQLYGFQNAGGGFNNLVTVDPTTGALTVIGPIGAAPRTNALDFSPDGTLFGVRELELRSYDISTGAVVKVVDIQPFDCTGFACSGTLDNRAFAISSHGRFFAGGDTLVEINPTTGVVSIIGDFVNAPSQSGMDFAPDGTLYLVSNTDDALYTVDILTGLATLAGPLGLDFAGVDLAFDSTGTLFASAIVNDINPTTGVPFSDSLLTIDLTTGAATIVTSIDTAFRTVALAWGPPPEAAVKPLWARYE